MTSDRVSSKKVNDNIARGHVSASDHPKPCWVLKIG